MSRDKSDSHSVEDAIHKLEAIIDAEFTAEEARGLKDIVVWWGRLRGAIALGGALGSVAKWALLMAAFFVALRSGLVDWLLQGANK